MGNIYKGTIAGIEGNTARVLPSDAGAKPTAKIVIPWHLRGSTGNLTKGTPVVYVEFDDASGLLLGRADGEWGAYLPGLTAGTTRSLPMTVTIAFIFSPPQVIVPSSSRFFPKAGMKCSRK